jgi:hypothetical protein
LVILIAPPSYAEKEALWEFEIDTQGWSAQSQIEDLRAEDGMLTGTSIGNAPFIVSPFPINIDADEKKILVIDMMTESEYEDTVVLWRTSYYNQFNMARSARISLGSRSRFHKYYINLGNNPGWEGVVQHLLLFPMKQPGKFKIKSIKLESPNPINTVTAAWQEFTAYETLKGSTVNTIRSPMIFGRRVNFYVLIFLALCFLAFFLRTLFLKKWQLASLREAAKSGLYGMTILLIIVWCLLEVRQSLDYIKTASLDFKTYWGKSLDEKRAIILLNDFHDYLVFCNESLPERVEVNLVAPHVFFTDRAGMHLYPHIIVRDSIADYVLVYDQEIDKDKYKDFDVFKKFKDNKYILYRRTK